MKKVPLFLSLLLAGSILGCANNKAGGHKHSYEYVEEAPAGCETTGVEAHYKCTGCDKLFILDDNNAYVVTTLEELTIAALGHDKHSVAAQGASCTVDGCVAHEHCDRCEKLFIDGQEVGEDDVKIAALGHSLVTIQAVLPTCVDGGNVEYQECERCHKIFIDGQEVLIEDTLVGALGHQLVDVEEHDSTCSTDGYRAHKKCERCQKLFVDGQEVTAESLKIEPVPYKHLIGSDNKCTLCDYEVTTVIDNPNVRAGEEYNIPINDQTIDFSIKNLSSVCGTGTQDLYLIISNVRHNLNVYVTEDNGTTIYYPEKWAYSSTSYGAKVLYITFNNVNYQNYYHIYSDLKDGSSSPVVQFSLGHRSHMVSQFGSCSNPYCEYTTANKATLGENIAYFNNLSLTANQVADIIFTPINDGESHEYRLVYATNSTLDSFTVNMGKQSSEDGLITDVTGTKTPWYDAYTMTENLELELSNEAHGYFRIKNVSTGVAKITYAKVVIVDN